MPGDATHRLLTLTVPCAPCCAAWLRLAHNSLPRQFSGVFGKFCFSCPLLTRESSESMRGSRRIETNHLDIRGVPTEDVVPRRIAFVDQSP